MKRSRSLLGLVLASVILAGGLTAYAASSDPCDAKYPKTTSTAAKIDNLKAYDACRFDRIDARLAALAATPKPTSSATPTSTPKPTASPSTSPTPTPTKLSLVKEPSQPPGDYYGRFPKAKAAGWGSSMVPIAVFLGKPEHAASLKSLGINTYMGVEHDGSPISTVTSEGISVLAQDEWTTAEIGSDTRVVGWQLSDECDMGYSGCGDDQNTQLATQKRYADTARARNDGRFLSANFGNGVLRTFWSKDTMAGHIGLLDSASVDKYAYTSTHVQGLLPQSPDWPNGADPKRAAAYGWLQDQMERFQASANPKPNWVFVETAKPYLTESGATSITPDQIDGAVWSAIIHGARGIAYFQHNNNGTCGNYSLIDCSQVLKDRVKAIDASVQRVAPIINSDSYVWDYRASGVDTMTKQADNNLVTFAGIGLSGTAGSKTFTLPAGVTGASVEVVGETRTLPVSGGKFTDTFSAEFSHHVYRVKI